MDNAEINKCLTAIIKSVHIMQENADNIDVLKFYTGELSVLSSELMSIIVKTD